MSQLHHLELIEYRKQKRSNKKQAEKHQKNYDEIDWQQLYNERKLQTLLNNDLDLYVHKHNIQIDKGILKKDNIHVKRYQKMR